MKSDEDDETDGEEDGESYAERVWGSAAKAGMEWQEHSIIEVCYAGGGEWEDGRVIGSIFEGSTPYHYGVIQFWSIMNVMIVLRSTSCLVPRALA